jgi:hypothetical protein
MGHVRDDIEAWKAAGSTTGRDEDKIDLILPSIVMWVITLFQADEQGTYQTNHRRLNAD